MTSRGRARTWRATAFAAAVATSLAAILVGAARPDWRDDLLPAERLVLAATGFRVVAGSGEPVAAGLRIRAAGERGVALQSMFPDPGIDATKFAVLRYAFADFPATHEVSFLFRRADRPDDVQAVSLPWPGRGVAAFDLSDLPAWGGRIIETGFAEYPIPQAIPPATGFAPFVLRDAELWSPSWRGALAVLATDWSGRWPWSQRSVHALGRDATRPDGASLVAAVALGAAAIVAWAYLLLGLRGRRLRVCGVACGAAAWLLLDLHWQSSLAWRLDAARAVYADLDFAQRTANVVDDSLRDAADEIRDRLAGAPPDAHVVVAADSAYTVLRLVWHLQPLNVAVWAQVLGDGGLPAPGTFLVLHEAPTLRGSAQFARILAGSRVLGPGRPDALAQRSGSPLVLEYIGPARPPGARAGSP